MSFIWVIMYVASRGLSSFGEILVEIADEFSNQKKETNY